MELISLLGTILLLVAYGLGAVCQWITYKNLKKELNEVKIIIHNTSELKQSLNKTFEGVWNVSGTFDKFQGVDLHHTSGGVAVLTWSDGKNHYDVNYAYSVERRSTQCDTVTAICEGHSFNVVEGDESKTEIGLQMSIAHRSSTDGSYAFSSSFKLQSQKVVFKEHRAVCIQFDFNTGETKGQIEFRR